MIKGAIFGSLAAGTQEYIGAKLHPDENGVQSGNKGDSGTGTKYSPINPCDKISQEVAESFRGATFTEKVLTEDTIMYREVVEKLAKLDLIFLKHHEEEAYSLNQTWH